MVSGGFFLPLTITPLVVTSCAQNGALVHLEALKEVEYGRSN
jgi:hypothetical protein